MREPHNELGKCNATLPPRLCICANLEGARGEGIHNEVEINYHERYGRAIGADARQGEEEEEAILEVIVVHGRMD